MEEVSQEQVHTQQQAQQTIVEPKAPAFFQKMPFIIGIIALLLVGTGGFVLGQKIMHPATIAQSSPTPTPVSPTANWKTYNDPDNRFTFKYPPDWTTLIVSSTNNVIVTTPDIAEKAKASLAQDGGCHPFYPIQISETPEVNGLGVTNDYLTTIESHVIIDGVSSTEYIDSWKQQPPCAFMTGHDITIPVGKNGRIFDIALTNSDNQLYKDTFDTLISTFTFTNVAFPTNIPTPTATPETTYTDTYFHYAITYPNTWIFRRTYDPDIAKLAPTGVLSGFDIHLATYGVTTATIVMNMLDAHGYTDIEKWIDSYDLNYPKNATRSSTTFRGYPALLYTDTTDATAGREYIYFLAGKYAYRITTVENGVIRNATRDIVSSFTPAR